MPCDHSEDPSEYVNIAGRPELAATVRRLEAGMLAGAGATDPIGRGSPVLVSLRSTEIGSSPAMARN